MAADDVDGAERFVRQALQLRPNSPEAMVAEGRVRLARRDVKGAIAEFKRALQERPESAEILFHLADAEFQDGSARKAFRELNRAIVADPSYAEAYTARGHIRQISGDLNGSLADFKRAEDLTAKKAAPAKDADDAAVPHETPSALAARGPATPPASPTPALEPPSADVLTQRGIDHAKQGDNAHALADLNAAIRLVPSHEGARLTRARLLAQMGDLAAAIADCHEVIHNDPKNASAYLARGYVEGLMGSLEDSLNDLSTAIRLNTKDITAYLDRATTLVKLHRYDDAIKDATMAATQDPTDNRAFLALGSLYSKRHDYPRAIENYKEAVRLKPTDVKALNAFSWLLATCPDPALRDGVAAVTYARQACERTDWKDVRCLDTFAAAAAAAGDFDSAVTWESKCIELETDGRHQDDYRTRLAQYQQHRATADDAR